MSAEETWGQVERDLVDASASAAAEIAALRDDVALVQQKRDELEQERDAARAELAEANRLREEAEAQIDKLARHIIDHVQGEPSRSEGAIDTAIRLLSEPAPDPSPAPALADQAREVAVLRRAAATLRDALRGYLNRLDALAVDAIDLHDRLAALVERGEGR